MKPKHYWYIILLIFALLLLGFEVTDHGTKTQQSEFPMSIEAYADAENALILEILVSRVQKNPFNIAASLIFLGAIIHSFMCSKILEYAHKSQKSIDSMTYGLLHFLGEIEVVFGLWTILLGIAIAYFYNWETFVHYVGELEYVEPMFVIVIMTIAASRPILKLVELVLWKLVKLIGGKLETWWFIILTIGPLLGSFITEPAAMIISAYLLSDKFFDLNPNKKLKYVTLALLFVNISVGGTLTNFAAPPILMVANAWSWTTPFLFFNIGWKAIVGIVINNLLMLFIFKKDFKALEDEYKRDRFKKYIQRKFIDKAVISEQIDAIEWKVDKNLGYTDRLNETSDMIKRHIEEEATDEQDWLMVIGNHPD